MTWGQANHIHSTHGHDEFIRQAKLVGKSETFIRNVCNNNQCKD